MEALAETFCKGDASETENVGIGRAIQQKTQLLKPEMGELAETSCKRAAFEAENVGVGWVVRRKRGLRHLTCDTRRRHPVNVILRVTQMYASAHMIREDTTSRPRYTVIRCDVWTK